MGTFALCNSCQAKFEAVHFSYVRERAQEETVDRVVLPLRAGDIREPLCCKAGPLQGMGHHQVVQKGCVLLPYFILLVNDTFFYGFIIGCFVCGFERRRVVGFTAERPSTQPATLTVLATCTSTSSSSRHRCLIENKATFWRNFQVRVQNNARGL